nr:hypothetical protein [Alkalinema sp. FACHB-956]
MSKTVERQDLVEVVKTLPDEALAELANFLDYLRYKTAQAQEPTPSRQNFLLSVAGLGQPGKQDISAQDKEILHRESEQAQQPHSLAHAFEELRQICVEEDYHFDIPTRQNRPNPFADFSA